MTGTNLATGKVDNTSRQNMAKRPKQRAAKVDGEKIKALSRERGMNQTALAHVAGVHPRTLQRAERGDRIRLDVIGNIANALKVQASEIMLSPGGGDEGISNEMPRPGYQLIRLKRIKSARELANLAINTDEVVFQSDVEVTAVSAHDLSEMMLAIENLRGGEAGLVDRVSAAHSGQWLSVEPDSIRFLGNLQSSIDYLGGSGDDLIGIFVGNYQETFGHGDPEDDSPETTQLSTKWTFDTIGRMVVRFSRQRVGSFTYEVPMGLTHDEANAAIQALREKGYEVHDRRYFRSKDPARMTDEEFAEMEAKLDKLEKDSHREHIHGKAAILRFQDMEKKFAEFGAGKIDPDTNVGADDE